MDPFVRLSSRVAPLLRKDVDTDQIIPAEFLKGTTREGLGAGLFANWRFDESGRERSDFELARPACQGARVLLAGENFGCGSSREHAVWALQDYGFNVVISTRFADIFRSNSGRNGLLTAQVTADDHACIRSLIDNQPESEITVDLFTRLISLPDDVQVPFEIDPFARLCLLDGLDPMSFLLARLPAIEAYEDTLQTRRQKDDAAGAEGTA